MVEKTVLLKVIFLVLILSLSIQAQDQYPQPQGWVNDFAHVLDTPTKDKLNSLVTDLEKQTTAEIAVVVVETTAPLTPKNYVTELFNRWGVGKKGVDNGIMILLAIKDRRVEIETGYGIEGILPDGKMGDIIRTYMVPHFKNNQWGEGLLAGTQQIARVILEDYKATLTPSEKATREKEAIELDSFLPAMGWAYYVIWILYVFIQNMRNQLMPSTTLAIISLPGLFFLLFSFFPFIIPFGLGIWAIIENVRHRCTQCGKWLFIRKKTLRSPTYSSAGLREVVYDCSMCRYHEVKMETIPKLTRSSSGSSSGGWSSGGGSSGSFGGGSSGGGGAGSSF